MQGFRTEDIRNVLLLSHTGAGKTSLAEAMLYDAGVTTRLGKVDDGNTVADFEPEEIKRRSSISTSLLPFEWKKTKINVIDVPGYFDFVGEVKSALRVADGAVIVVCAASGVEVGTEIVWEYADEIGLPRIIFVNKIDRENADFSKVVEQIEERFGRRCVPVQFPIGSQDNFQGVFDLISMQPSGYAIPQDWIDAFREKLVEGVAETDDDLATKYLEGEEITEEDIRSALRTGIRENKIAPILMGTALRDRNIPELLDAICNYLPSPKDRGEIAVHRGETEEMLEPDDSAPLSALVFKTSADPYVGKMSYLRVFSGAISSDSSVWNAGQGKAERIGQLYTMRGKTQEPTPQIVAGDIGVVTKLADTGTGDTLSRQDHPVSFDPIEFPPPSFSVAVYPKTKADFDKLGMVLSKLNEEDPSLSLRRDADTGETILSGHGEAQLEVVADKMKRKFSLAADFTVPRIPYKETVTVPVEAEYKHKKQTGGHGQYGHVLIRIEPLPRGGGYEFEEKIVGGAIPKNYIPAVGKGITEGLQEGVLAGCPIVDLKVILYDGTYHPVDSSDIAFKIAGSHALRKGVSQAQPVLLEPIMSVTITVPDAFTGDVMGGLNGKRARIMGMNPEGGVNIIEAQAPLAEMLRYSIDLRSMTQGRGSYTIRFSHYEEVPAHLAQKIIAEAAKEKDRA
ncbi:elongation factor G [Dehalococcoidia bacterium]|nr:elongation factor G [Dehalococcoidia bacterium]MCL0076678.1 elongation factor G [Dehalococcoidia bacterium]